MKEKKCKVCSLFDERKFSDEIRFDINKLIKSKEKLEILNKQTGFNFTNKHYYKVHHDTCLLNFEIPVEEQKIELIENKEIIKNSYNSIDILSLIEKYRIMSIKQKENQTSILMNEINFISLNIVHQLINGRDNLIKGLIPKDDISCLKIINDIMKGRPIDEELQDENIFDVIPIELIKQVIDAYHKAKELNPQLKITTKDGSISMLDLLDDKKLFKFLNG